MLRACLLTLLVAAALSGFVPAATAAAPAASEAGTLKRLADRRIAEVAASAPAAPAVEMSKGALRVTLEPRLPPTSAMEAIPTMLSGGAVSREAASKVCEQLKISVDKNDFKINSASPSYVDPGLLSVDVMFNVPQHTPPLAGPFLAAVAEQLQQRLQDAQSPYEDRLRRAVDAAVENRDRTLKELAELRAKQQKFHEEAGRTDLSRESILAEAKALETEQQKLQMDQVGHTARQKALEEQIAKIAAKAEARAAEDPVAAELKKIIDLREQELGLARQLHKTGQMAASDVGATEIKLAEARAEWMKRREAAGSLVGRDLLSKLNEELSAIEVDNAETAARLGHIRKQLAMNREILPIADKCQDSVVLPLKSVEREVQNTRIRLSEAEQRLRDFVPATVVAMPPK